MLSVREWNSPAERFHGTSLCETCLGVVRSTLTAISVRYENRVGMFGMSMKVVPRKTPQFVLFYRTDWGVFIILSG